jgi:hypothetical protein
MLENRIVTVVLCPVNGYEKRLVLPPKNGKRSISVNVVNELVNLELEFGIWNPRSAPAKRQP